MAGIRLGIPKQKVGRFLVHVKSSEALLKTPIKKQKVFSVSRDSKKVHVYVEPKKISTLAAFKSDYPRITCDELAKLHRAYTETVPNLVVDLLELKEAMLLHEGVVRVGKKEAQRIMKKYPRKLFKFRRARRLERESKKRARDIIRERTLPKKVKVKIIPRTKIIKVR